MNKQVFLTQLRRGLSGLPKGDIDQRLTFYNEMIEDRMEDGIPEEAAVSEVGNVGEIVSQIIADVPLTKIVKERITPKKKPGTWEIVLLALGSPIWLSFLLAAFAVMVSLYAVLWTVIIVLWAVFAALVACGGIGIASGTVFAVKGSAPAGMALIGAGIVCAGLSIFAFFGCRAASKGAVRLTGKITLWIKSLVQRGGNQE